MNNALILRALIKKQLTELIHLLFVRNNKMKKSSNGSSVGIVLLLSFAFLMIAFSMGMLCYGLADSLYAISLGWLYHGLIAILSAFVGILSGSFFAKAQLFEAKDNELLLSMPIPPSLILISRIVGLYLQNLFTQWLIQLPAVIVPAILGVMTPSRALLSVFGLFLLPLLSTALSCLLGFLLAALFARFKHKNLLTMLFSLLFITGYFVIYSRMSSYLQLLVTEGEKVGRFVRKFLYPFYLYGISMMGDWAAFLLLLAGTALLFGLICLALSHGFFKVTTASHGVSSAGSRVTLDGKSVKASTPEKALLRKELSRFFSCTAYMLNAGLGSVIVLVGAVFLCFKIGDLQPLLADPALAPLHALLAPGIAIAAAFCVAPNTITAPSVSLEGKSFSLLRALPVPARSVLMAKIKLHLVITLPPALLFCLLASLLLRLPVLSALLTLLFTSAFVLFSAAFGLICDLWHPNFDWQSEVVVIKQSLSVLFAIFGGWLGLLLIGGIGGLLCIALPAIFTPTLAFFACTLLLAAADALLMYLLNTWGARRFDSLSA